MTAKRLFIILFFIIASMVSIYFGAELLIASLSGTPGEKLSPKEKKMVRHLQRAYGCKVRIVHHSKAVKPTAEDSAVNIYFSWKTDDRNITNTAYNIASEDDSTIMQFSNQIARQLLGIVPQKEYYNSVNVIISNAHFNTDRELRLKYSITPNGELFLMDFTRQ